jgi:hypothetical protein
MRRGHARGTALIVQHVCVIGTYNETLSVAKIAPESFLIAGSHTPDNAIAYAMHSSRSHDAVIRVYDDAAKMIETREHKGDFKEGGTNQ